MKIKLLDELEPRYWRYIGRDKTIEEKFDERYGDGTDGSGGFTYPKEVLLDALTWTWLKWHKDQDINQIHNDLTPVIERAIALNADTKMPQWMRDRHDSFLIQLAILAGDIGLMRKAAYSVKEAEQDSDKYQMYESWSGILKYRILQDQKNVERQYEIFQKYSIVTHYLYPTRKMIKTFVEKDYKSLLRAVKQRAEKFWEWAEKSGAFSEENGKKNLDFKKLNPNFRWPWVECTFAKLAVMDGADYTFDSPWLPLGLVKAFEK